MPDIVGQVVQVVQVMQVMQVVQVILDLQDWQDLQDLFQSKPVTEFDQKYIMRYIFVPVEEIAEVVEITQIP